MEEHEMSSQNSNVIGEVIPSPSQMSSESTHRPIRLSISRRRKSLTTPIRSLSNTSEINSTNHISPPKTRSSERKRQESRQSDSQIARNLQEKFDEENDSSTKNKSLLVGKEVQDSPHFNKHPVMIRRSLRTHSQGSDDEMPHKSPLSTPKREKKLFSDSDDQNVGRRRSLRIHSQGSDDEMPHTSPLSTPKRKKKLFSDSDAQNTGRRRSLRIRSQGSDDEMPHTSPLSTPKRKKHVLSGSDDQNAGRYTLRRRTHTTFNETDLFRQQFENRHSDDDTSYEMVEVVEEVEESEEESESSAFERKTNQPSRPGLRPRQILAPKAPQSKEKMSLRESRRGVERYQPAAPIKRKTNKMGDFSFSHHKASHHGRSPYRSPRHRRHHHRRNVSSSSSDSSETEFENRREKALAKMRARLEPVNIQELRRVGVGDQPDPRVGKADVQPMIIDNTVTWDSIGGLDRHIQSLKEMVVLPLLYPEVFEKYSITPPRGVLFHGPPGTGKTLMARALANVCSTDDQPVAFFMRKGADVLSKWVGESERQLRLLFEQAYKMQPSIIFFDEIDGLCPVRSSKQDQIHSSIVSTVLALMDGLDSRGQVVVIGATNRLDAIDPALRRPGRFDREFVFTLPGKKTRRAILDIHTRHWTPELPGAFKDYMASETAGFSGADLKALCTETVLLALRRRYPQIYESRIKLQIDAGEVQVMTSDFNKAKMKIVPTSRRSVTTFASPLPIHLNAILNDSFLKVSSIDHDSQNYGRKWDVSQEVGSLITEMGEVINGILTGVHVSDLPDRLEEYSEDEREFGDSSWNQLAHGGLNQNAVITQADIQPSSRMGGLRHEPCRPRVLIHGKRGMGQQHICTAMLHILEEFPVHSLALSSLFQQTSAKSLEDACVQVIFEAQRTVPSILFWPHVDSWWATAHESLRVTLTHTLSDLPPHLRVLVLASSDTDATHLPPSLASLFPATTSRVRLNPPTHQMCSLFFDPLCRQALTPPVPLAPPSLKRRRMQETLLPAPVHKKAVLDEQEIRIQEEEEEHYERQLRILMRDALNSLMRDRRFRTFIRPVNVEEVPDYYQIIKNPLCLLDVMERIDDHYYQTKHQFLSDMELIVSNAREYNPANEPSYRHAAELQDRIHILVYEFDKDVVDVCAMLAKKRENMPKRSVAQPKNLQMIREGVKDYSMEEANQRAAAGLRTSARKRGFEAPSIKLVQEVLESVERRGVKPLHRNTEDPDSEEQESHEDECHICNDGGSLLCCSTCTLAYHISCVDLPEIPDGDWPCPECVSIYLREKERERQEPDLIATTTTPQPDTLPNNEGKHSDQEEESEKGSVGVMNLEVKETDGQMNVDDDKLIVESHATDDKMNSESIVNDQMSVEDDTMNVKPHASDDKMNSESISVEDDTMNVKSHASDDKMNSVSILNGQMSVEDDTMNVKPHVTDDNMNVKSGKRPLSPTSDENTAVVPDIEASLKPLLDFIVENTTQFSVSDLEALRSSFLNVLVKNRRNSDRETVVQILRDVTQQMSKSVVKK